MKLLLRSVFVILSICASVGWSQVRGPQATDFPLGSAIVSDVKGEVFVTLPDQSTSNPAQKGQALGPNTTVECKKGSALLALADGSQVLLKSNTRIILRAPGESKGNFLEELIGRITATVKKRTGSDPAFKMGTPTAVITVRGTRFVVDVSKKQQTFVQVFEGIVEVDSLGLMGHPVYVQPGFVTQVGVNHPPENPRKLFDDHEAEGGGAAGRHGREQDGEGRNGQQPSQNGTGDHGSEIDD